ncbi:F-box/WD repeat-containing protein 9 isoform X2 [Halyomorpha halys]|uniref:F-box/WD repeat-containing protein 9 isoform X2 n=1 Tax=Halyomorpha halys TaxID=286706 RepID=UPI0006D4E6FF|nr:F-box/WD repeat-containing protein mec-15-like [Halyomorpha halys]
MAGDSKSTENPLNLASLPVELLNIIFSKLNPCYLQDTVRLVCKRFAEILSDDAFWKLCFRRHFGVRSKKYKYPLLQPFGFHEGFTIEKRFRCGDQISWREITSRLNKRDILWGKAEKVVSRFSSIPHSSEVDAVRILPNHGICVTGGRDKMMCLWNLDFKKNPLLLAKEKSHNGWVWDIAFCQQDEFFSCGWDNTIKGWNLSNQLSCFKVMRTSSPPMCMDVVPGLIAAGLLTQEISMYDPRIAILHEIHRYNGHSRTVTSLKIVENKIYSVSEDKTISIYDTRNLAVIDKKKLKLSCETAFPRKMAVYRDLVYVGDSKGCFSVYHMQSDYDSPLVCLKVGNERPINSIIPSLEGVIVGTSDAGAKMIIPSVPMQVVQQFNGDKSEITSMDYHKNYLVVTTASSHRTVQFYTPVPDLYNV